LTENSENDETLLSVETKIVDQCSLFDILVRKRMASVAI